MATFVLIHGAGDSGWYWHLVTPELRARGHDVVAPDLPANDDTAVRRLTTTTCLPSSPPNACDERETIPRPGRGADRGRSRRCPRSPRDPSSVETVGYSLWASCAGSPRNASASSPTRSTAGTASPSVTRSSSRTGSSSSWTTHGLRRSDSSELTHGLELWRPPDTHRGSGRTRDPARPAGRREIRHERRWCDGVRAVRVRVDRGKRCDLRARRRDRRQADPEAEEGALEVAPRRIRAYTAHRRRRHTVVM